MNLFGTNNPRVQITYEVEIGVGTYQAELPYSIGIISDLYGDQVSPDYVSREFISVDKNNFNIVLKLINPTLNFAVNNLALEGAKIQCNLSFSEILDFSPYKVLSQVRNCQNMLDDRKKLIDLKSKVDTNSKLSGALSSIAAQLNSGDAAKIANESGMIDAGDAADVVQYKAQLVEVYSKYISSSPNPYEAITNAVLNLDEVLSAQLDLIMHHPKFKALESKWRGLYNFICDIRKDSPVRVKVLSASSGEISHDIDQSSDFTQSTLYQLVYENEYGTIGGIPFACLLFDYNFNKTSDDIKLLSFLGKIASVSHAPLISGASAEIFNLSSFAQLHIIRSLSAMFAGSDFVEWNGLRGADFARYINLVLPKFMIRTPYSPNANMLFNYKESVNSDDDLCWGNSAYLLLGRIVSAFEKYNWAAAIRGPEGGGLVENLSIYTINNTIKCPLETIITDSREKELSDVGFIGLCHKKMSNQAVFFSGQSIQQAKKYDTNDATINAIISTKLPYMLNASRFAHYMKIMLRNKIGTFQSKDQIHAYLQNWLGKYVLLSGDIQNQEVKAAYPLSEGKVDVVESYEPGEYNVSLDLKPHFQLEGLRVSISFVAKLTKQA